MNHEAARHLGLGQEILGWKNSSVGPYDLGVETPPVKPDRWCAHCGRLCGDYNGGYGSYNGEPLCHPNEEGRPDCYVLVLAGHSMPCLRCLADRVTDENVEKMLETGDE